MGDVIVVTNSPPIGHMRSQLTNYQVEIKKLYYYIRRPDVVERIGSYMGTSFPLFHVLAPVVVCGGRQDRYERQAGPQQDPATNVQETTKRAYLISFQ